MQQLSWFVGIAAFALTSLVHAEAPPDASAVRCATELMARLRLPAPRPPPRYYHPRPARETPGAVVGARVLAVRGNGTWLWAPVNEPFALTTYTSLFEMQAWLDDGYPAAYVARRLALPPALAETLRDVRYARDLYRQLLQATYVRGRRLVCFDEDGVPL